MAAQGVMPLHRKVRNSGTERMSRAVIFESETGDLLGAAGVKTAKLCAEQDQIGKRLSAASAKLSGRLHKGYSNRALRGMTALQTKGIFCLLDRIRLIVDP